MSFPLHFNYFFSIFVTVLYAKAVLKMPSDPLSVHIYGSYEKASPGQGAHLAGGLASLTLGHLIGETVHWLRDIEVAAFVGPFF